MPGGIMKFADFFGEIEIDDEELINDDHQGHLVAEAHRIVSGDSVDPPTVEHLAALITTAQLANRPPGPGRGRKGPTVPRHQRRRRHQWRHRR